MTDKEFKDFIQSKRENMLRVAINFTKNTTDAEDLTQETIISLWQIRDQLNARTILNYALVSVKNKCLTALVRARKLNELTQSVSRVETPFEKMVELELSEAIDQYLTTLNIHYQNIFLARVSEGLTLQTIAERFDESKNNVSVILSRIRSEIRKIVSNNER